MKENHKSNLMLVESYLWAEKIMQQKAKSFYQAFKYLPSQLFKGVNAVYAFCRCADDIVDQNPQEVNQEQINNQLQALEDLIWAIYSPTEKQHPIGEQYPWFLAFKDTIHRYKIPIEGFLAQIEGQRMDGRIKDIQSFTELIKYCKLVAGSVGIMMLPILAAENADLSSPGFKKAAESLGVGMQITNILRDVGEDLRIKNRVYIPLDLLSQHNVSRSELARLAWLEKGISIKTQIPKGFILAWEELADVADSYYLEYKSWLPYFHPQCQLPLVGASLSYHAIADAVREQDYNCFTKRCYTSYETRLALIKQAEKYLKTLGY